MSSKIKARVIAAKDPYGRCSVHIEGIKYEFTRVLVRHGAGEWGNVYMNGTPATESSMMNDLRWARGVDIDFDMGRVLAALDRSVALSRRECRVCQAVG